MQKLTKTDNVAIDELQGLNKAVDTPRERAARIFMTYPLNYDYLSIK